ncbi:MAG: (2Fe-2S)-binding protein [Proteobacteria bacterium]|nr:(2Fe-2S)-binding protein [Pseudomonadota bacterium]MCP4921573.1 (2Fe-2S)-binding protein [Pseudomonadota bacterium]
MILCLCHGVSDRDVRKHVDDGAGNLHAVSQRCRAGSDCGSCANQLRKVIRKRRDERERNDLRLAAK